MNPLRGHVVQSMIAREPACIGSKLHVRFQVLTAARMKFRVFWDVVPCSHVEVDQLDILTIDLVQLDILTIDLVQLDILTIDLVQLDIFTIDLIQLGILTIDLVQMNILTIDLDQLDILTIDLVQLNILTIDFNVTTRRYIPEDSRHRYVRMVEAT
jgi:hypothetical protein